MYTYTFAFVTLSIIGFSHIREFSNDLLFSTSNVRMIKAFLNFITSMSHQVFGDVIGSKICNGKLQQAVAYFKNICKRKNFHCFFFFFNK